MCGRGPPYLSDDAEPTEYQHYEIYAFANGDVGDSGSGGEAGIDFNYGATPDLQLTAVLPMAYASPNDARSDVNLGNIELAGKYRFLHQDDIGVDVAVFPRLFLPAGSAQVGERHVSFLLPLWFEKDWGKWSGFGGGGCVLNQGGESRNFCLAGWAVAYQLLPKLQIGGEVFHQTADTKAGRAATVLGAGLRYDLSDNYHLLGYIGPTVQNAAETNRYTWYASILFTF
ncbi:MAG TPA: transporter [Rhizomicrobium sp.]|nr:transporter [Rhizomicrobium sp.]